MLEIVFSVFIGAFLGMLTMALIGANRYSRHEQRVQELEHEIKTLRQRGRKPQPKKKPVRRRNA
jgi:uncharacterized membrane protein (DUF106 family)